jgi:hypothetical protein
MAHLLPQYKRFNNSTQRHSIDPTRRSSYVRHDAQLTTLLSYVYADIIQICLELLCIFCREFQGTWSLRTINFSIRNMRQLHYKTRARESQNGGAGKRDVRVDPAYSLYI